MEGQGEEQHPKSRIVKVDSSESWDFYVGQAANQGCPVSFLKPTSFTLQTLFFYWNQVGIENNLFKFFINPPSLFSI